MEQILGVLVIGNALALAVIVWATWRQRAARVRWERSMAHPACTWCEAQDEEHRKECPVHKLGKDGRSPMVTVEQATAGTLRLRAQEDPRVKDLKSRLRYAQAYVGILVKRAGGWVEILEDELESIGFVSTIEEEFHHFEGRRVLRVR